MPMIRLRDPLVTGSLEKHDYTHAKIVEIANWNLMGNSLTLHVMHGAFDAQRQEFVPASIQVASTVRRIQLRDGQYSALVAEASAASGESFADGFLRAIYKLLMALPESPYVGVLVDNQDKPYGASE